MGLEENYQKLAHEIIKQAAKDWRQAARRLKKNPRTTKEYLQQAYRLDKRINSHIREKEELMQMATSVSSTQWKEDVVQTSKSGDAPFLRTLEKMWEFMSGK